MSKNKLDILKTIKELFSKAETAETFAAFKLKDGTATIEVDKMEVGGKAMLGDQTLAAGEYELEDGSKISVDATGLITAVTPAPAPVDPNAPVDMTSPEGMRKAYDKFATGTPEERLANLEVLCKALMEYSFGWQIREAQDKAIKEAAIKVYTDNLKTTTEQVATANATIQSQKVLMASMIELVEELVGEPNEQAPDSGKKKFSFSKNDTKKKSLEKFQAAAAALSAEQKLKIA